MRVIPGAARRALVAATSLALLSSPLLAVSARAADRPPACSLLRAGEIQQVLGKPTAEGTQGAGAISCRWIVDGGSSTPTGGTVGATLQIGTSAQAAFQQLHQTYQQSAQDLPGLGSAAFFVPGPGGGLFVLASPTTLFNVQLVFRSTVIAVDRLQGLALALAQIALPRANAAGSGGAAGTTTAPSGKGSTTTTVKPGSTKGAPPHHGTLRPPATNNLSDNLLRRVHQKQWTLAEGIRQTLAALLAGKPQRVVTGNRKLGHSDLTGVVLLAQQYVRNGKDAKAKRDISTLLGQLMPTSAQLEDLARPPGTPAGRSAPRQTTVPCSDLWAGSTGTTELPGGCLQVDELDASGAHFRIFTPVTPVTAFDATQYRANTSTALVASAAKYATLGHVGNIDVVFDARGFANMDAAATAEPGGGCVIAMYPIGLGSSPEYIQFVMAHEAFHCFEQYNITAYNGDYDSQRWWIEGGAEYFANAVYPTYDFEYQQLGDLLEDEPGHAVVDLSYSAFLFWQEFANERSDAAIVAFFRSLPVSGGRASDIAALAGLGGVSDLFDTYARNYIAGEITDTSGEVHSFAAPVDRTDVDGPSAFMDVQAEPFVINRVRARFIQDHVFETKTVGSEATRSAASPSWVRAWAAVPDPIDTKCSDRPYIVESTNATVAPEQFVAKVTNASDTRCEIDNKVDNCLVGLWRLDNTSFDDSMGRSWGRRSHSCARPANLTCSSRPTELAKPAPAT